MSVLEPCLGGLSSWRRRGRGLSLPIPTTPPTMPPLPVGRKRGRGFLPLSPPTSPPLEDYCPLVRHHLPSPPPYTICNPDAPPHYNDLFPPQYATFCIYSGSGIIVPTTIIVPPNVCSMILLPLLIPSPTTIRVIRP